MNAKLLFVFTLFLFLNTSNANGQWTAVCTTGNGFVDNFETYNDELYATGFFKTLCGTTCQYLAKWDGAGWQAAGNGFKQAGHHLQVIDHKLYGVRYEPNIDSNWVYQFDGNDFVKFGEGVYLTTAVTGFSQTANLYNILDYEGKLTVCGEFNRVGARHISGIMQWSGTGWDSLGAGLSGNIPGTAPVMYPHALCQFGTDLIVAGNFKKAGGQVVNGIARWDGTEWHALGQGFNSTVYGICVFNGTLYAGGDFTMSGTTPLTYIAKWDGSQWVNPGFGLFYQSPNDYSFIHTLKVLNNTLFISGGFDRAVWGADTLHAAAVVAYTGTSLNTLGGGIPGKEVEALALYNGFLFAGGGLFGSSYIARYDTPVSASEPGLSNAGVTISPNPTRSTVQLSADQPIDNVSVFDMLGRAVYHVSPKLPHVSFDLPDAGIFFVTVECGQRTTVKKLVVCK